MLVFNVFFLFEGVSSYDLLVLDHHKCSSPFPLNWLRAVHHDGLPRGIAVSDDFCSSFIFNFRASINLLLVGFRW